jgi:hypothetical protein
MMNHIRGNRGKPGAVLIFHRFPERCKLTLSPALEIYDQVNYLILDEPQSLTSFSTSRIQADAAQCARIMASPGWDFRAINCLPSVEFSS